LAGVNKYYNNIYAGVLGGYGILTYKYNPINNSKDNDTSTTSLTAGVQAGYNYSLNKKLSIGINGKVLFHNYTTDLTPNNTAKSELSHDYTTNIGIGLIYKY
jgi:hypothetical protein